MWIERTDIMARTGIGQAHKKRRELESKELVKAFEKSKKSLKEIIEFMNGDVDEEDQKTSTLY